MPSPKKRMKRKPSRMMKFRFNDEDAGMYLEEFMQSKIIKGPQIDGKRSSVLDECYNVVLNTLKSTEKIGHVTDIISEINNASISLDNYTVITPADIDPNLFSLDGQNIYNNVIGVGDEVNVETFYNYPINLALKHRGGRYMSVIISSGKTINVTSAREISEMAIILILAGADMSGVTNVINQLISIRLMNIYELDRKQQSAQYHTSSVASARKRSTSPQRQRGRWGLWENK